MPIQSVPVVTGGDNKGEWGGGHCKRLLVHAQMLDFVNQAHAITTEMFVDALFTQTTLTSLLPCH